MMCIRR